MKRRSLIARLGVFATVAGLLFSQAALAMFACSAIAPQEQQASAMSEMGCHESDPGAKHLCFKTCLGEPQKHEVPSLAALPPRADTGLKIALPQPAAKFAGVVFDAGLERATSPPPTLLYARFLK
jgi:hypothetical protein